MQKILCAFLLGLSASVSAIAASDTSEASEPMIENSYIVTFKAGSPARPGLIAAPAARIASTQAVDRPRFGEHGTGQSKEALGAALRLRGKVLAILETTNAAHLEMDALEADRLRHHPGVERVEQNRRVHATSTVQLNPGWALDRIDQSTTQLNNQFQYNADGSGQTVYVLDSGLDLANFSVASQFSGRASVFWDVNGGNGADCHGHGTQVASAIGGNSYGVARGAKLVIAKITFGCTRSSDTATLVTAFNWLAANAPRGTIVNVSYGIELPGGACGSPATVAAGTTVSPAWEAAINAAYDSGLIIVASAGNDGCNTAYYTPTRMPQAFVVGATSNARLPLGQDARAPFSRVGSNISTFAPGVGVRLLNFNGGVTSSDGTSFSAPYVAGIFAAACGFYAPFCSQAPNGAAYQQLLYFGTIGTVVNPDGSPLAGTTPRFISRLPW